MPKRSSQHDAIYLDGPKDKFFNIFSPPDEDFYERIYKQGFYNIENYSPSELLDKTI